MRCVLELSGFDKIRSLSTKFFEIKYFINNFFRDYVLHHVIIYSLLLLLLCMECKSLFDLNRQQQLAHQRRQRQSYLLMVHVNFNFNWLIKTRYFVVY